ncbi:MAG: hypothetical protein H8D87_21440 [Deltaproteobacteria bacterium]|uniref:hypothetical protein n=1 Tax=Desulfobacula sp. TaxID=2593537 RepID=UPI0019A19CF9|nr:hypothetical protein [Candidatus Desulfobacula maris]MBL6993516.1 hypothetical protein [Desulfobacula sp.]
MKTIKYIWWLIVLSFIGIFVYQNLDYFMTTAALKIDLKIASWNWAIPELQNIAYFGICFLLGIILASIRGFMKRLGLKKEIKTKDAAIASFKEKIIALKSELDVFQHDPYIKKELSIEQPEPAQPDYVQSEPVQPDYVQSEPVQPDFEQPDFVQPDYEQPDFVEPESDNKKDPKSGTGD